MGARWGEPPRARKTSTKKVCGFLFRRLCAWFSSFSTGARAVLQNPCRTWLTGISEPPSYRWGRLHSTLVLQFHFVNVQAILRHPRCNLSTDLLVNWPTASGNPAAAPKEPPSRIGWTRRGSFVQCRPQLVPSIRRPDANRTTPPRTRMPNGKPRTRHARNHRVKNHRVAAAATIRTAIPCADECA
jgi:hypothetical protein